MRTHRPLFIIMILLVNINGTRSEHKFVPRFLKVFINVGVYVHHAGGAVE